MLHCVAPRYVAGDGDLVWVRAQLESGELGPHTRPPGGSQQHATMDQRGPRHHTQQLECNFSECSIAWDRLLQTL